MDEYEPTERHAVNWWSGGNEDSRRTNLQTLYSKLRNDDAGRLEMIRRHMRMYGNSSVYESGIRQWNAVPNDRLRLNVIKSCCDTVTSKISTNNPHPKPMPVFSANWGLKRRCEMLDGFLQAQMELSDTDFVASRTFLDAAVMGTGLMKVYRRSKEIITERVWPGEIFVDEQDGIDGDPKMMIQRKFVDRDTLCSLFPKKKGHIKSAKRVADQVDDEIGYDNTGDQVLVIEAWRKPSLKGGNDGRHMMVIDSCTLVDEKWGEDLPFVWLHWTRPLRGFWGIGLAEELTGIQVEINRLLRKIQAAMDLVSVPRVFVEEGSKVKTASLINRIGMVVPYRGQKPVFHVAQAVHPELMQHLWQLYSKAYEISGVSQMSAGGHTKLGADASGEAMRTLHDIETQRFQAVAKDWERMYKKLAHKLIAQGKAIGGRFPVKNGTYSIESISWSEFNMDEDKYLMQVMPMSDLPSTPAGRKAWVMDMVRGGMVDIQEGRELINFTDLRRRNNLATAQRDNVERIMQKILDKGEYESPEPFFDLDLCVSMAEAEYNLALDYEDIEEDRLQMLRDFMDAAADMKKAQMAEQQAMQAAPAPGAPLPSGMDGQPPNVAAASDGVM
jgi:hypothetical protein